MDESRVTHQHLAAAVYYVWACISVFGKSTFHRYRHLEDTGYYCQRIWFSQGLVFGGRGAENRRSGISTASSIGLAFYCSFFRQSNWQYLPSAPPKANEKHLNGRFHNRHYGQSTRITSRTCITSSWIPIPVLMLWQRIFRFDNSEFVDKPERDGVLCGSMQPAKLHVYSGVDYHRAEFRLSARDVRTIK